MGNYIGFRAHFKLKPDTPDDVIRQLQVSLHRTGKEDKQTVLQQIFGYASAYFKFEYGEYLKLVSDGELNYRNTKEALTHLRFIEASGLSHWEFMAHGSSKDYRLRQELIDLVFPHLLHPDIPQVFYMRQGDPRDYGIDDVYNARLPVLYSMDGKLCMFEVRGYIASKSLENIQQQISLITKHKEFVLEKEED